MPVGRILQPDRIQGPVDILDPRLDHVQGHIADPLAEQKADAIADEAREAFENAALDQPQLDPLRHAMRERPIDPEAAVQHTGQL